MQLEKVQFPNKEELRGEIMRLYGRDVAHSSVHYSSRNYAFVFSEGSYPCAIRCGVGNGKTRQDVVSELMWVDDLRLNIPTISQAVPSANHRIAEDLSLNGQRYCLTMFRKANGDVLPEANWHPGYFREAGRVLGAIHRCSAEGYQDGFRYKRPKWYEKPSYDFSCYEGTLAEEWKDAARAIYDKVRAFPETPSAFSMIHGDYQRGNLFVDWDNVWVFDFDDCCYGHFMNDIATALYGFLYNRKYEKAVPRAELAASPDGPVACFRAGYESEHKLPDSQWALLEDFMRLRVSEIITLLLQSQKSAPLPEVVLSLLIPAQAKLLSAAQGEFLQTMDECIDSLRAQDALMKGVASGEARMKKEEASA